MAASEFSARVKQHVESRHIPALGGILLDKSGKHIYNEAFGTVNISDDQAPAFTTDTEILLFSCTKLIVGLCALQLVERGLLALDDPVSKHFPRINELKIANELDADGQPIAHAPQKEMKTVHLLTHSSGITYDFFGGDEFMHAYRKSKGQAPGEGINPSAEWQYLDIFLDSEPGTTCRYGQNFDILGFVVESISGLSIEDYIDQNIAKPLGMTNTGAVFTSDSRMVLHVKTPDGLIAVPAAGPSATGFWKRGGGHFLVSSLTDYSQVLLTLLNDGTHPPTGHQLLSAATVERYLFQDWLAQIGVPSNGIGKFGESLSPGVVTTGDVFGHLSLTDENRGMSCGLAINKMSKPGYRSEGSGAWAGLGNLFYWIDRTNGKAGIIGTSLLPFLDRNVMELFDEFEKLCYAK